MTTVVDFVYKWITREVARCFEVLTMLCRSLYTYIDVILTDRTPPPHTHKLLTINITFTCTQNLINPENSCNNILLMSNWWMRFLLSLFFLRRLELVSGKIQCPHPQKALVHRNNHIDMYTYINILQDNSLSVGRYNTHATHKRWNKKIYITASLRCWSNYQKPSSINNWFTWTIPKGKRSLLEHLCPSKKSARIMYS